MFRSKVHISGIDGIVHQDITSTKCKFRLSDDSDYMDVIQKKLPFQ